MEDRFMKRLQLLRFGNPEEVIALNEAPEPALKAGEVLVKLEAASINPSDFLLVKGYYGLQPTFPFNLGAEGVGRVVTVGDEVDKALQGKRVLILPTSESGTWADHLVATPKQLVPAPEEADALQLAMIGINPATAYLLLREYVKLQAGDWIGQTAANSAMGQYIIQFAKLAGLKTLNVVRREEAAEQVRQSGGDLVLIEGPDLAQNIKNALQGEQLSLILDTVGGGVVSSLAQSLKNGGPVVSYAMQSGKFPAISPADFFYRGLSLHGFWLINWIRNAPHQEIETVYGKLAGLVSDGTLHASVDATYGISEYKQAITHSLQSGRNGKVLFRF
jgi:NADPH:quinone reductase-like Zn-dependent oxidoreductase